MSSRLGEIGVRLALGADARRVFAFVLADGLRLSAIGAAIGLIGALAASSLIRSLATGVSASDPRIFAASAAVILTVAALAASLPARRASTVDPIVVCAGMSDGLDRQCRYSAPAYFLSSAARQFLTMVIDTGADSFRCDDKETLQVRHRADPHRVRRKLTELAGVRPESTEVPGSSDRSEDPRTRLRDVRELWTDAGLPDAFWTLNPGLGTIFCARMPSECCVVSFAGPRS